MNIIEAVKNLAAKEREVRKLEMLIEHVASLKEDELAKVLSALAAAGCALSSSSRMRMQLGFLSAATSGGVSV